MYKGNYGVILGKNCRGILKEYWKIFNSPENNLRKILRNSKKCTLEKFHKI